MIRIITAAMALLSLGATANAGNYYRMDQNTPMLNGPGPHVFGSGTAAGTATVPETKVPDPTPVPDPNPAATAQGVNTSPNVGDPATGRIVATSFKGTPNFSFIGGQPDGIDIGQDGAFTGTYLAGGTYIFSVLVEDTVNGQLIFADLTIDVGVGPVAATASPK